MYTVYWFRENALKRRLNLHVTTARYNGCVARNRCQCHNAERDTELCNENGNSYRARSRLQFPNDYRANHTGNRKRQCAGHSGKDACASGANAKMVLQILGLEVIVANSAERVERATEHEEEHYGILGGSGVLPKRVYEKPSERHAKPFTNNVHVFFNVQG